MTIKTKKRITRYCLLIVMLSFGACSVTHGGPQDGTETGNPPVIDVTRVLLVVGAADAKISGGAGAVSPGGGSLQVQSSLTGKTYTTEVANDGSFEIAIFGFPEDIFELRAADENGNTDKAAPVYIARGSAAVSGGAQGLTCKQRENLAGAQMNAVVEAIVMSFPNNYCKGDSECRLQQVSTVCTDACSGVAVSTISVGRVEEAREAIASGICRDFSESGCTFTVFPCVPPTPSVLRCVSSACTLVPITRSDRAGCSEAFEAGPGTALIPSYWYSRETGACLPRTYGGLGGNANRYATRSACEAACQLAELECEAPRVAVNVCIESELPSNCSRSGTACALPCTSADDCRSDPLGGRCVSGFCGSAEAI